MEDAGSATSIARLGFGKMQYGCAHYKRRCKIRAPCCGEIFGCRHCHNDATAENDRHQLPRHEVEKVICLVCVTEQQVAKVCSNCGVNMGEYFCDTCKFYDDDISKEQFHCDDCGICRVGGRDNFFHCPKCGSCYGLALQNMHECVENSMKHHCPICYEYLFDSLRDTRILKCGHTMHKECFDDMIEHNQYACPICYKSSVDMESTWRALDQEVASTIMPAEYRYKKIWILCNDCNKTSQVYFHIVGHKCSHCKSYNTRTTDPPTK